MLVGDQEGHRTAVQRMSCHFAGTHPPGKEVLGSPDEISLSQDEKSLFFNLIINQTLLAIPGGKKIFRIFFMIVHFCSSVKTSGRGN